MVETKVSKKTMRYEICEGIGIKASIRQLAGNVRYSS